MNDSAVLHIQDERFSASNSRELKLIFRLADNRISYAIIDDKDRRLQLLYDAPVEDGTEAALARIQSENPYLNSTFAEVTVVVVNPNFALLPQAYFTRDELANYSKLAQAGPNAKTVVTSVNEKTVNCVSAVSLDTLAPLVTSFPDIRVVSQPAALIEGTLALKGTEKRVLIQFNNRSFELCVTDEKKIIFYNLFDIDSEDDFIYYFVNVLSQLKIDASTISPYVSGNIEEGDTRVKKLEQYVQNVHFADALGIAALPQHFDKVPRHQFFALFSTLLCE